MQSQTRQELRLGAQNGPEGEVNQLPDVEGIDDNTKDDWDQTPLSLAAQGGHEAIGNRLLGVNGIDVNSMDKSRRTPLSRVASSGHRAVVELPLSVKGINVNHKDDRDQTPLSWAASEGHTAVVEPLLRRVGGGRVVNFSRALSHQHRASAIHSDTTLASSKDDSGVSSGSSN
ncbi:MAG: hypothetical protein M1840_000811 [Geoglossum simile]|nr:MAG: hypothetical protein M1840_000811 [Geoglossum simile]